MAGSENYVGKWLNGGRRGHGLNYKCFAQQFVSSPVGPGQRNFFEQTLLLGEVSFVLLLRADPSAGRGEFCFTSSSRPFCWAR